MDAVVEKITETVASIFGNNVWLATIFIAMIPLAEIKVGIPFALNRGYKFWPALWLNMLGSLIICALLALVFKPIINWLKRSKHFNKIGNSIDEKITNKSNEINKNIEDKTEIESEKIKKTNKKFWLKFLSVVLFVAVPIPLTGVWTGTCIAVAIGLSFTNTLISVFVGNFIAGTIVSLLTKIFGSSVVFVCMIAIVAIILIYLITTLIIKKIKNKKAN